MQLKTVFAAVAALFLAAGAGAQDAAPPPSPIAPPALTPENSWLLDLSTGGRVTIQLRPDLAPNHVERIKTLTGRGFYNGLTFHRVIEGFMAQGGDPKGDGSGGSDLPDVNAEFNIHPHVRGVVAAARASDENSANSQFYIMLAPRFSLDLKYTVFGRVVSGMEFVDKIERGEPPINPTRILQASLGSDNRPPPAPGAATPAVAAPPAAPDPIALMPQPARPAAPGPAPTGPAPQG